MLHHLLLIPMFTLGRSLISGLFTFAVSYHTSLFFLSSSFFESLM